MTTPQDLIKSKKLPGFIKNNKYFLSVPKIDKIFPRIGLSNFSEVCDLNNFCGLQDAKDIIYTMSGAIYDKTWLVSYSLYYNYENHTKETLAHLSYVGNLCNTVYNAIRDVGVETIISIDNTTKKICCKLPTNVLDLNNKLIFKEGESLFKVYNKLNNILNAIELPSNVVSFPKLEEFYAFKNFSSSNIGGKSEITFSSDGIEGLWDIATMSMRGVESCQSWSGAYKSKLIGSIVNPYIGIIYLSTGKSHSKYGSRMVRRCVVKFVVDAITNKPTIYLDRMYPSFNQDVLDAFTSAIKSKISPSIAIKASLENGSAGEKYFIPKSKVDDILHYQILPYEDTKLLHGKTLTEDKVKQENIDLSLKRKIFSKKNAILRAYMQSCGTTLDDKSNIFSENVRMKDLSSKEGFNFIIYNCYKNFLSTKNNKSVFNNLKPIDNYCSSVEFVRDFLLTSKVIFKNKHFKYDIVKQINNFYSLKENNKIKYKDVSLLINKINNQGYSLVKKQLKDILLKKTKQINLP